MYAWYGRNVWFELMVWSGPHIHIGYRPRVHIIQVSCSFGSVWLLEEVRSSDHLNPFVGSSCGRPYHCDKILTIFSPNVLLWCPVTCLFDHYEKLDAPHFMTFGYFVFNLCVVQCALGHLCFSKQIVETCVNWLDIAVRFSFSGSSCRKLLVITFHLSCATNMNPQ